MAQIGLHFMAGKKRSGKTMVAVKLMWKDLGLTNRIAVGNVPVVWAGAQKYLEVKYDFQDNLHDRLYIITDVPKLRNFYAHRGFGWQLPVVTPEQWGRGQRNDLSYAYRWKESDQDVSRRIEPCFLTAEAREKAIDKGELEFIDFGKLPKVIYFLDEIQNIFPAKQAFPEEPILRHYLSQQSKLSDIILCTTQTPDWVDKSFRDLADDWMFLTNWGRKQRGIFRLPRQATWSKYPKQPGANDSPDTSGTFRIDIAGLGQTYDTSAGVGIEGGLEADTEDKTPGIHWAWVFAFFAVAAVLCWSFPKLLRGGFNAVIGKAEAKTIQTTNAPSTNPLSHAILPPLLNPPLRPEPSLRPTNQVLPKTLTGILFWKGRYTAYFSDGTQLDQGKLLAVLAGADQKPNGVKTHEGTYYVGIPK